MAHLSIYSNEFLTTLARADESSPIDMPESETIGEMEFQVAPAEFEKAYRNWDPEAHAVLQVQDELSGLPMWLSQEQAERVHRAIEQGKASVSLG